MMTTWTMGGSASRELEQCNQERQQLRENCNADFACLENLITFLKEIKKTKRALLEGSERLQRIDRDGTTTSTLLDTLEEFEQTFIDTEININAYCDLYRQWETKIPRVIEQANVLLTGPVN